MKNSLLLFLLLIFSIYSCNVTDQASFEFDEIEIINKYKEIVFIAGLAEIELSNLIDPRSIIDLGENTDLVKLEPNESQIFSTKEIGDYYPGADFRIYIYAFGVTEAENPSTLVQLTSIFTVKNEDLIKNNTRVHFTK
ncbi:MAG: hypothetical protein WEA58_02190 [Balneolaceae bacterium]